MENYINDWQVRLIGIIFFGFVIPNATGMMNMFDGTASYLLINYVYFMLVAFTIWHGNRWILFKLDKRYNWFINPVQKIIAILGMNVLYTSAIVIVMLSSWYITYNEYVNWEVIKWNVLICVVCVIFITHAYETVFLIKQRQEDILKEEQLERSKIQSELEALKNQIDPHFMFNALNNLSYLIEPYPEKAKKFTENLAEIYRYILHHKNQKLVLLEDELLFLDKYLALLRLRYNDTLMVNLQIAEQVKEDYLIPPNSIFFALENVVKHNEISNQHPMHVEISKKGHELWISNIIQQKANQSTSSGLGLKNLDERFKIIMENGISSISENGIFTLKMPLLKIGHAS